ncbi:MAG: hypothetical protein FJ399_07735 [Verrucomicrobia bacterium]|nr:hypothetical protein [Verrucomicrobiota bacterium]
MPLKKLTKGEILAALRRLSELAAAEGVRLEMTLYGGAVMLLAYDARDVTKDVDAIVHPPEVARRLAHRVAAELGWPEDWLNDEVRLFLGVREAKNEFPLPNISRAGLHITRPTARYLLAMKVMACRKPLPGYAGDLADIRLLLRVTRIRTLAGIEQAVDAFFPDTVLPDTTRLTLGELLKEVRNAP